MTDVSAMNETDTIKIGIRAVLEVVESGSNNIEVALMKKGQKVKYLSDDEIAEHVKEIEKEREEEENSKKSKPSAS